MRPETQPCVLLLFPEEQAYAAEILQEVGKHSQIHVESVTTADHLVSRMNKGGVRGIIASVSNFDPPFLNVVGKLQGMSQDLTVVVISESVDKKVQEYLPRLSRVVSLDRPVAKRSLSLLCEKIVQGHLLTMRRHKRYNTNQAAVIERLDGKEVIVGRVYNMSKGGAYVEISNGKLEKNNLVKLSIELDKLGKQHVVHGRVMWVVNQGFHDRAVGIGIEFMSAELAYQELLSK